MDWCLAQRETVLAPSKARIQLAVECFCSLLCRNHEKLSEMLPTTPRAVVCVCQRMYPCSSLLWLQLWASGPAALGNTLWSAVVRNGWGIYIFKFGENFTGAKLKKESQYSEFLAGISTTVRVLKQLIGVPNQHMLRWDCPGDKVQFAPLCWSKSADQHAQG